MKFFDQTCDRIAGFYHHAHQSGLKIQVLDSLGCPLGFKFCAWNTPDFFCIGFEEHFKQAFAKTIGDPLFEGFFFLIRENLPANEAQTNEDRLPESNFEQSIPDFERIIKEFVLVKNSGEPWSAKEVIAQYFVPHLVDRFRLGEEA